MFSTSQSLIRQRPSVRALQTGGYTRASTPNPNSAVENVNTYASDSPTHIAGGMSAQEYNAMNAERGQANSQASRDFGKSQGGLSRVVNINSVPSSKSWDAFFGAMDRIGVDQLKTGAASGMDSQLGFYDQPSISALQQQRGNSMDMFDTNRAAANFQDYRRR